MKKNGYLRKFIALFLVFVMLMADSSMTTLADTIVGSYNQTNDGQQSNTLQDVTVKGPDGTYYVKLKYKENDYYNGVACDIEVVVKNGTGSGKINTACVPEGKTTWLEIGLKNGGDTVKSGELLKSDGKIYNVNISDNTIIVNPVAVNPGTTRDFKSILGQVTNYGIVANEATFCGHLESNFAIGKLINNGSSNVQMAKNASGGAGCRRILCRD